MLPTYVLITRDAVADNLVGARGDDPVVLDEPAPSRHRTRIRLAGVLRHAADRLAPAQWSPAR
jgi:hypothetical protein